MRSQIWSKIKSIRYNDDELFAEKSLDPVYFVELKLFFFLQKKNTTTQLKICVFYQKPSVWNKNNWL